MELRDTIVDWLTRKDTSFLLGAGCSRCAGKPLIYDLTERVIQTLDQPAQHLFHSLTNPAGRTAHIEDFINFLQRVELLANSSTSVTINNLDPANVRATIEAVKLAIVSLLGSTWEHSEHHGRFLARIALSDRVRNIFILNYDTLIEASLEELQIPYVDGFRGANRAYFDASTLDQVNASEGVFRVFKLHGSTNWIRDVYGTVRRVVEAPSSSSDTRVMIYPSEQKYLQTQFGAYEVLLNRFRQVLRSPSRNNTLVCLGYSFNDDHINEAIIDAACDKTVNLTVIAFLGADDGNLKEQQSRLEAFTARCRANVNFYVGNRFFVGDALSLQESEELLTMDLWRFEHMVEYIAGVKS